MARDAAGQADALGALSQFFISDGTLGDTLLRVAQLACEAVGPADLAGLTLLVDGKPATGVFTDPEARRSMRPSTSPVTGRAWTRSVTSRSTGSTPPPMSGGGRNSRAWPQRTASWPLCRSRSPPAARASVR
jgi:hypothetical protein